jgi:hypothetical protein
MRMRRIAAHENNVVEQQKAQEAEKARAAAEEVDLR